MQDDPKKKAIADIARKMGILRPHDLEIVGLPDKYITRMEKDGLLVKTEDGLYAIPGKDLPGAPPQEN